MCICSKTVELKYKSYLYSGMSVDNAGNAVNEFINVMENCEQGTTIELPLTIDGVRGNLTVHKCGNPHNKYSVNFEFTLLCCCTRIVSLERPGVKTAKELVERLKRLKEAKVSLAKLVSREDYEKQIVLRKAINELWGTESEECYVCQGDTVGMKTDCGHNICISCYQKTVGKKDVFVCGICRTEKTCDYCDD